MSTVAQVISQIDGFVGTISSVAKQGAMDWAEQMKTILRSPLLRDKTDLVALGLSDIDENGADQTNAAPMTTAYKVWGLLVGTLSENADSFEWVITEDADTKTFDGTAALANATTNAHRIPAVTTSGVEEFYGWTYPTGVTHGTGLTVALDGVDGTNAAASAVRGIVVFQYT